MGKQPVRTLLYGGLFLLFLLSLTGCSSAADTITAQDAAPPPGDAWKTPSEEVNAAIEGLVYPGEAVLMGYGQELEGAVGTTYTVSLRVPEEMAIVSTYYQELLQGLPGYHRTQRFRPRAKGRFFQRRLER